MKTFSHCPKCKDPMLHEHIKNADLGGTISECWRISCDKRLTHEITCLTVRGKDDEIAYANVAVRMATNKTERICVSWDFERRTLTINKSWVGTTLLVPDGVLPFFEPDFINYDKLINKLKTCLTFS